MGKKSTLFEETPLTPVEVNFPLYYKNNSSTKFVCLQSDAKFEEVTLSKDGESFRGGLLFGFNEQVKSFKDIKLMYHAIARVHTLIEQAEYESAFNKVIQGRQEFFNDGEGDYVEIVHPLTQEQLSKYIKHRWKPVGY